MNGKWGYSTDEETYHGTFETEHDAKAELLEHYGCGWVGQFESPPPPESFVRGDLLIEHVVCQDDYMGDYAEGTLECNRETEDELTEAIQKVFREWIEKHGLQPTFALIRQESVVRCDRKASEETDAR